LTVFCRPLTSRVVPRAPPHRLQPTGSFERSAPGPLLAQDAFRRIVFLRASGPSTRRFIHADPVPCGTRPDRTVAAHGLKARSAIRTPIRSDACLYTRLCGTSCSQVFPMSARSRPRPGSFSEPTNHPVRGRPAHLELVRPSLRPPAFADDPASNETRCVRPTSASHFLNTSTRAS